MKIDFKKLIIGVLVFSVLLVAFSLVYYYVYFLPQLEIKQIELERQKQEEEEAIRKSREYLLDQCLNQAYDTYIEGWNRSCERLGKEKDCTLPSDIAERWDKSYQEHMDLCFKRFSQD